MSQFAALHPLRIGCVQYLNAKPLIHGYDGTAEFDHPSKLAERFARGEFDVALLPTFEVLRTPGALVVDGVSISSRGPVHSVFLAYRGELAEVKRVALDPASLTSTNLLRVVLAEFHNLRPEASPDAEAKLLIGNQAIAFRREHGDAFRYLDLGEEWTKRTGLPFVYAVWTLRPDLAEPARVAKALRALKERGVANIAAIAAEADDPEFAASYLGGHIRYDLGADEKAAMEKFSGLLRKHRALDCDSCPIAYC